MLLSIVSNMTEQQRFNHFVASVQHDGTFIFAGLLLQRAAQKWPDKQALICDNKSITYKELYYRALLCSKKLEQHIKARDKAIIFYENSINFYIAYYALWQLGAVVVPVNVFSHEKELAHIIRNSEPTAIFVSPTLQPKLTNIENVPALFSDLEIDLTTPTPEILPEFTVNALGADELAVLLYTSGTTGMPKGVMLSSRTILTNVAQGAALLDSTHDERVYAALPLFHSYMQNTCLWSCIAVGATTILVPKIDRKNLLTALAHNPTIMLGIPGLYGLFCLFKTLKFPMVKYFVSGGDALPDKIRMGFELLYRRKICNGYGLTESAPFISVDLDDYTAPTNTVGKPVINLATQLRDEQGLVLSTNAIGTLWVKGDNVMQGYYNAPEATAQVLHDGWLNTGDLATFDTYGKIIICGREKDLIKNKGMKIYPQEIENVLISHPLVTMAGVIGMQENGEEIPVAFVAVKQPSDSLAAELRALCAQNLAPYKIPKKFFFEKELPTTSTGKVNKKDLRARFEKS